GLLALAGPVEQDVVPETGVEIFQGFQLQALVIHHLAQITQLLISPDGRVASEAVGALEALGQLIVVVVVIGVMHDDMGDACLAGKTQVVAGEIPAGERQSELHRDASIRGSVCWRRLSMAAAMEGSRSSITNACASRAINVSSLPSYSR